MRILYVANFQGPAAIARRPFRRNRALGASTKIEALASILGRLGNEVTILTPAVRAERSGRWFGSEAESLPGAAPGTCRVEYLSAWDLPVLNLLVAEAGMKGWLRRRPPWDLALVYNLDAMQMAAAEMLSSRGTPVVFEYEDDVAATLDRGRGTNPPGLQLLERARRIARGALTVNEELKEQLGVANCQVVEGLVPDRLFDLPPRPFRRGEEPLRILYSGSLSPQKGVLLLLEAVRALPFPHALTITGSGPLQQKISEIASGNPSVRFLGEVSREGLEAEYGRAHVCVNPHHSVSGQVGTLFPFKIAEYLASGCRVVSSRLGTMSPALAGAIHLYRNDAAGDLARALEEVAGGYDAWDLPLEHARRYIRERLSWAAVGERMRLLLEEATR
jgi:glycosyltransferase involved in cell wall biosynthesis